MAPDGKILIIQTAFPGDVVLTLPLAQVLHRERPDIDIQMVVTPRAADLLRGSLDVRRAHLFDKRGRDGGLLGLLRLARTIRAERFDAALIPHRSMRSALLAFLSRIPRRIGFDRSAGKFLLTGVVAYDPTAHEITRNLSLLGPLGIEPPRMEAPTLSLPESDLHLVDRALAGWHHVPAENVLVALAPGSVWKTKRWLPERFALLGARLLERGHDVVLLGGGEDAELCRSIVAACASDRIMNMAGQLSLLQSAAILSRSTLLVTNDSAPMHLAGAVGTPVIAIFGATAPSFGFAPSGPRDHIVEIEGLACRPCAIHGGNHCPIGTFDCMDRITVDHLLAEVDAMISQLQGKP